MRGGGRRGWLARILDGIERAGNRLPDPLTLFVIAAAIVVVASGLATLAGVTATHPGTGEVVRPVNLLSRAGLRRMLVEMVPNFTAFPPLGTVLVVMLGIGVAERSGLVAAALRRLVTAVPAMLLPATLVFAGVMSSLAADAGYVVLTPLGAVVYAGVGRNPLAGLAAAFAGVSAGFSANLLVTALDPLLAGITQPAAQLVDPTYVVDPTSNYYFMVVSTVLLTVLGTIVTTRVVEPRLGEWTGAVDAGGEAPKGAERRGLVAAGLGALGVTVVVGALVAAGVLRDADGSWAPFFGALVPLLMLFFLVPGLAYGLVAGTIRSDRDVAAMASDTMATMGSYVVLAFVAAQLVAYFAWSNLGLIVAVQGAGVLKALGIGGLPLLVGFVLVSATVNLLIGSASAKWAIMAPVFVPMLMLMGYAPETTQVAYRVGDSVTNVVTPLLPYFPIVISFAQRYDRRAGLGTLVAAMLPYAVTFLIGWLLLLVLWIALGVPLGPGAPIHWAPG
jgi:aminobenzoyl-glutamate transport protein